MPENRISFSIKDWSVDDKPREKLRSKGRSALTDAELVAILIGSGSREESAVQLSKRILQSVDNNLNELGALSILKLQQFKGIGEAKAISIIAALELGRRRTLVTQKRCTIKSSKDAFELLRPFLSDLAHEEFWIVYLNNSNKVLHLEQLSKGGITGTLVDVRLVMKHAIEKGAVGCILAHNHPSGTIKPSTSDKEITQKLKKAGLALDIKILDHLIMAQNNYLSFADEGIL